MKKARTVIIGAGGIARHHVKTMLRKPGTTSVVALVEPHDGSAQATLDLIAETGRKAPARMTSWEEFLKSGIEADTALICTPHNLHYQNVRDALKADLDVLVEKPMVITTGDALRLKRLSAKSPRILSIAFNGSHSPAIRKARELIAAGRIGEILGVNAFIHQRWFKGFNDSWRLIPEISGGGFLFDTGSHMVNTTLDLIDDDVREISVRWNHHGAPVELNAAISGSTKGGVLFSMLGVGENIQCKSQITVFGTRGQIQTGAWGELLRMKTDDGNDFKDVKLKLGVPVWETFLQARAGKMTNPCPVDKGVRFARFMDLARKSAESGQVVRSR
jgi:predicted dehydrogenase